MPLIERETWTVIQGMALGAIFLMTRTPGATRGRRPSKRSTRPTRGSPWHQWSIAARAAIFLSLVAGALAGVVMLWPHGGTDQAADQVLQITMAGFSQPVITARAGQPLRLLLVNPDSPFHTDGGGWHQFAVPALGLDIRVPPRSQQVVEIPAAAPGEYEFYCDICCGGKDNPTMRGVLRVQA